ncbi:MAG: phosphoribosylformylglycinamidine cyclo-ligase [Saprospiraceae bacterium]|nr:phosphoribosylformylglycinamidine cyclo-ligase [Saprospiraceae bacterium]
MEDSSKYESRGVSSDKKEVHQAIRKLDQGLFANTFCKILADPFSVDPETIMMLHADTAGTKTILAYLYWKETGDLNIWKGIAQDALVMNLDDMACSAPVNQFVISNTILRNKKLIPGQVLEAIIDGTMEFANTLKAYGIVLHHAGGETADVGDVVRTLDVGFTAYSSLKKSSVFEINIQPGDLVLGIGSSGQSVYETDYNSGIACNGLTSARHDLLSNYYRQHFPETFDTGIDPALVYSGTARMTDPVKLENNLHTTIGQMLLSPTRTFLPLLYPMLKGDTQGLHGIIHCTGGAHSKVLKFAKGVRIVKNNLPTPPLIFDLIGKSSGASLSEMYNVYNMGTRLEIYGTETCLSGIQILANSLGLPNRIIGRVDSSPDTEVVMEYEDQTWTYSK